MASHAAWSPLRHCSMRLSGVAGCAAAESADMRVYLISYLESVTGFSRQGPALVCDGVPLADLAIAHGTPLYVYSGAAIASRYRAIDQAFADYPHAIHYALKANSTLAIARLLRSLGSNVDAIARDRQTRVTIALRVNPDIDAKSHPHISTGLKTNKFGIALSDVTELCARVRSMPGLEVVGLHSHVGSQITDLEPLRRAAAALAQLARELRDQGTTIEHLDLGGGLGVSYDGSRVPDATEYANALLPVVRETGLSIILEPGRQIVAPAGVLLTRVIDVK